MRDVKEFQERFNRYKNGESVSDIYNLPKYEYGKTDKYSLFVSKLGPSLYRKLLQRGVSNIDSVYDNMMRQLAYESTYGTSRVAIELHNYGGYGWNGKTYTTFTNDDEFLDHYLNIMTGRHKNSLLAQDPLQYAKSLKKSGYYEDTVENYSRNLVGMKSVSRAASIHKLNNPDLYSTLIPQIHNSQQSIIEKSDALLINQTIPEQQTMATWTGAEKVSPYVTGRPMVKLKPTIKLPNLIDLVEDSEWEPTLGFKNGKLPKYGGGKVDLGVNPTNATINDDGTFTDDYTKIFSDFYVTPTGVKTKYGSYTDKNWNRYKLYLSYLKYHDLATGKLKGEPGLELPLLDPIALIAGGGKYSGDIIGDIFGEIAGKAISKIANVAGKYALKKQLNSEFKLGAQKANTINEIFQLHPVLMDTKGNLLDYNDYLNSIFPDSKIKDILWHGSKSPNLQQFDVSEIGTNAPIKGSVGMYLSPDKNVSYNYAKMTNGKVYPVLLNTKNPYITNQHLGISFGGVNVANIKPKTRFTTLSLNDAVIAPNRSEIAFFDPGNALILGSLKDITGFLNFMNNKITQTKKIFSKDGYIYRNGGITPAPYKYYGRKPNYKNPLEDELSDYDLDYMLGDYIGKGAERSVYLDLRNNNRVLKITDGGGEDVWITDKSGLSDYIDESLRINNLPSVPELSYEGFIKDDGRFLPVFSLQKVTPLKKVADPFLVFTKQYVLPNGRIPSGKLSAIRKMNPKAFSAIGYMQIPTKPGVYSVIGKDNLRYNVTDLGLKNIGIDAIGNLKIFDPMFE